MDLNRQALLYHSQHPTGKIGIQSTKLLKTKEDLMVAYSPGVAEPCRHIQRDPLQADYLTARSHLVGVITNGTAVLGLGDIGPLAAKPVMEGKAVLLKKFAGLDAFDIEVNEKDPDAFVRVVKSLEPTFGAINLEDIKAPECFIIERALTDCMNVPVFHDDQHGTAIIVGAALSNALLLAEKSIKEIRLVCSGAGAAALACLDLLVHLGLKKENIIVFDIHGVVHKSSPHLDGYKDVYAVENAEITLHEALEGADVFLGLSVGGVLKEKSLSGMAEKPIILALANPEPEIHPNAAIKARPDAIVATGRSDYPNQVNNVLGFPYIFRGALDVGATTINWDMKLAALQAIARVAQEENSSIVSAAYGGEIHKFGPEFIIPKPFDPRLFVCVSYAVARAAVKSGVAQRPIQGDEAWKAYRDQLEDFIYLSNRTMKPIFQTLKTRSVEARKSSRLVFVDGENWNVLQAAQVLVDEQLARPILIGRLSVIAEHIRKLGLRYELNRDVDVVNTSKDSRFESYWTTYHKIMERQGITSDLARFFVRTQPTIIGALMVRLGNADAMVCGMTGRYRKHYEHIEQILNIQHKSCASVSILLLPDGPLFIADTHLNPNPDAQTLANIGYLVVQQAVAFGVTPKVALLSHSNFGSETHDNPRKMQEALHLLRERMPHVEIDGEMNPQLAWEADMRRKVFPNSHLTGRANIWLAPNIEAGHMAFYTAKTLGEHPSIGPLLLGTGHPVHIATPAVSVRGLFNYACLALLYVDQIKSQAA